MEMLEKNIHYASLFEKYIYVKLEPLDGFALIIARHSSMQKLSWSKTFAGPSTFMHINCGEFI